jgi:glutaconate CoA-transferase subunit B
MKANSSFDLIIPRRPKVTEPPTPEEIRILREEIDPVRIVLRK